MATFTIFFVPVWYFLCMHPIRIFPQKMLLNKYELCYMFWGKLDWRLLVFKYKVTQYCHSKVIIETQNLNQLFIFQSCTMTQYMILSAQQSDQDGKVVFKVGWGR